MNHQRFACTTLMLILALALVPPIYITTPPELGRAHAFACFGMLSMDLALIVILTRIIVKGLAEE